MKKNTLLFNRLFSRFSSIVLLLSVFLAPTISPIAASAGEADESNQRSEVFAPRRVDTTTTASNPAAIAVPDNPSLPTLYPSPITIAGAVGAITNVSVVLRNISIARPRDLDILLVSPTGQQFVIVSDVAGVLAAANSVNVTLTLQDGSPALPADAVGGTPLVSGTFRPTNNGAGEATFPAPAPTGTNNYPANNPAGTPSGGTSTFQSVYAQPGVRANGVWNLYVYDDAGGGATGTIAGGWTLNVTTDNAPTAAAVNVSGRVTADKGRGISRARIEIVNQAGESRIALTNPFGYFRFENIQAGETYFITVNAKGYQSISTVQTVSEELADLELVLRN